MFFSRTIRRKMVFGLILVLVMLLSLAISGISGLYSYRYAVHQLRVTNDVPRVADLLKPLCGLIDPLLAFDPLLTSGPENSKVGQTEAAIHHQLEFKARLAAAKQEAATVRQKMKDLRLDSDTAQQAFKYKPVMDAVLDDIQSNLALMESHIVPGENGLWKPGTDSKLRLEVDALLSRVEGLPDRHGEQSAILQQARREYTSHFWLVCATSVLAMLLFLWLIGYGYNGIVKPMRKLNQGAARVALGDFDYRLKLETKDEMAELAAAFNKMTARFQEVTRELDRKVHERSRQLVRSERLAGVGFLSAGVAHEINNPLQAIMMASGALVSRADDFLQHVPEEEAAGIRRYLTMIETESYRCKEITAKLLDFSRDHDCTKGRNDLTIIISEVLAMIAHLSKYRDRKIIFEPKGPCLAEVNGSEIKQVVLNLAANALEAMDAGGTLRISITERTDQVVLTFVDDGAGMTPEVLENLFEPFFTRRRGGKGVGLGMSITHRIVTDHGGTIEAESEGLGHGSTVRVLLPRTALSKQSAA